MDAPGIIVNALILALCLPHQTGKSAPLIGPVTILEKPLLANKKLIVTWEQVRLVLTPKQVTEREESLKIQPNIIYSNYVHIFTYFTETKAGQRSVVWTERKGSFGALRPNKAGEVSPDIEVFDVALDNGVLLVLYQQGRHTDVNIICLHTGQRIRASAPGSKNPLTTADSDAVQSPSGSGRFVEVAGPLDGVTDGRILGPTLEGNVEVLLCHAGKLKDGSPRITAYHLIHNAQGREFWTPDVFNTYAQFEEPGTEINNLQP